MKTYEATHAMLLKLAPLAQQYRSADAAQKERIRDDYCKALTRFVASGWTGVVGEVNELPDDARLRPDTAQLIVNLMVLGDCIVLISLGDEGAVASSQLTEFF
jgi:hypothetical protein